MSPTRAATLMAAVAAVTLAMSSSSLTADQQHSADDAPYNNSPAFDFTKFEDDILPKWLDLFRVSPRPGDFSFLPHGSSANLYGSADVAHLLFVVSQLNLTKPVERDSWAQVINGFQNSTGFFSLTLPEATTGFQPWHATGFANAALMLLQRPAAHNNSVYMAIANDSTQWEPTFAPLLGPTPISEGCATIWDCGHKIAAIPAVLAMNDNSATTTYKPFYQWWNKFLNNNVSHSLGLWASNSKWTPPNLQGLGGSFHIYFVYEWLDYSWPVPEATLNTSARLQHNDTGLWSSGSTPGYIDLDGLYQVVRPATFLGQKSKANHTCALFLSAAEKVLNDEKSVLDGVLATNTHNLPGIVAAVAECAKWFPDLVVTKRPWQQCLDFAPYV